MSSKQIPVLLSGAAASRRLDITYRRLLKAVEAGALTPVGLLDRSLVFAEEHIMAITADLIRMRQVRGTASQP